MSRTPSSGLVDEKRMRQAVQLFHDAGDTGLTRKGLAKALSCSLRTADRVREVWVEGGGRFKEHFTTSPREKWFVQEKLPTKDLITTKEGRLALRLAALTLTSSGWAPFEEQLTMLENLADARMSVKDHAMFENLKENIRVVGGVEVASKPNAKVAEQILLAFASSIPKCLELEYRGVEGKQARTLLVAPYCLSQDVISGGTYLLAWAVDERRSFHLRLNRITSAKVTKRPATIPNLELFKHIAKYQIGGWISENPAFEVVVRVTGKGWIQPLEEAPPSLPGFTVKKDPGGNSALVRFQANHIEGALRWILQMREAAQVLEPESLVKEMKVALKAMNGLY